MPRPIEMFASAFSYREPHNTLDYIQGWISLSLIHIPHISSSHILLFSPSLNALTIPVNIVWSASCLVPACKPGLHAFLGLWKPQQDWGPGQGTQQLPPIPDVCISSQHRPSITFEGWQPFSTPNISLVIPSSRSPPVLADFCISPVQQQHPLNAICMIYQGTVVFQQLGFIYLHHKALVLLQTALHKCKQMNSSQHHHPEIIKSPTVILLCFSRLPHLPVLRISAHTQHPSLCSSASASEHQGRRSDTWNSLLLNTAAFAQTFKSPHVPPAKAQATEISTAFVQHLLLNTNLVSATITLLLPAWPEITTTLLHTLNNEQPMCHTT